MDCRRDFRDFLVEMLLVYWPDLLNGLGVGECHNHRDRRRETNLKTRSCRNFAVGAGPLEVPIGLNCCGCVSQRTKFDNFPGRHLVEREMIAPL